MKSLSTEKRCLGTTLLYIASDAFERYQSATGAILDETTGLLTINSTDSLQSLFFNIGGVRPRFFIVERMTTYLYNSKTLNLRPMPKSRREQYRNTHRLRGRLCQRIRLSVGLSFVNEYFQYSLIVRNSQRFYTIFDSDSSTVGFANTAYTIFNIYDCKRKQPF